MSLDARSEGQSGNSLEVLDRLMVRLDVPVGGRVRKWLQWKINQPPSLKRDRMGNGMQ